MSRERWPWPFAAVDAGRPGREPGIVVRGSALAHVDLVDAAGGSRARRPCDRVVVSAARSGLGRGGSARRGGHVSGS